MGQFRGFFGVLRHSRLALLAFWTDSKSETGMMPHVGHHCSVCRARVMKGLSAMKIAKFDRDVVRACRERIELTD